MMIRTDASNITFLLLTDGCQHDFSVPLGCETHDYKHLWGWACSRCWEQVFYPHLDEQCEEDYE